MASETSGVNPSPPPSQNPVSDTTIGTEPEILRLTTRQQGESSRTKLKVSSITSLLNSAEEPTQPIDSRSPASNFKKNGNRESSERPNSTEVKDNASNSISFNEHHSPLTRRESPFSQSESNITPSPRVPCSGFAVLRGDGSIRAGTQLLIQALQAVPWENDLDNLDDPQSTDSENFHAPPPISSSIHAIYRPIARSRKSTPATAGPHRTPSGYFPEIPLTLPPEAGGEEEGEEDNDSDFEQTTIPPTPMTIVPSSVDKLSKEANGVSQPIKYARSGSLATVRVLRRARLAAKLKEIFEIKDIEEVVAEIPCWLLRSILLQGYMYLTNSHLCFFAHIPAREDQILKSGSLYKKTTRTKRWVKRWFVLKNDVLSWYQSSSDPYFPHGVVDLRYAISCESISDKDILLKTNQKVVLVSADSTASRDEWVKAIQKVIFKAQNMGESVKIAIPYSSVLEVDRSTAMEFSDTIEVKVVDNQDNCAVDSYFFAYFHNLSDVLEQMQDRLSVSRLDPQNVKPTVLKDTTSRHTATLHPSHELLRVTSSTDASIKTGFRLPSLLKSLTSRDGRETPLNMSVPAVPSPSEKGASNRVSQEVASPDSFHASSISSSSFDHTYPPSPSPPLQDSLNLSDSQAHSWTVSVPTWLKGSSLKIFTGSTSRASTDVMGGVSEVYTRHFADTSDCRGEEHEFDLVEPASSTKHGIDLQVEDKFRRTFAVDNREELLGFVPGYILRVLPVHGRFYISTRLLCFRSSQSIIKTRMMVPMRDILSAQQCKAFQFGCYGLLIVIKGHEELFFEFRSEQRRASCIQLLERQMEMSRNITENAGQASLDNIILEELASADLVAPDDPHLPSETLIESLPAVMFTSSSSTFLSFKPQSSLRFTFLTIGSRGDVQPYIALAKGLMADGHKITIATHEEYKEWVCSYGIDFACVGGDPAELMRICVENGMFTVSFLKETLFKFRGWLDDLLKSSWEACQGSDVLIESPSAMGGIHIAEALRIPYFRAFTMPWTRTRVYPHAFAVPERKMGGSYNYMSYVMFDQVFWRATAGQINRWRRDYLGICPTNLDRMMQHKVPFLYNFSPSVVPPPLDWVEWIRVTGYWFLEDANVGSKKWTPPDDLTAFIEKAHAERHKVVYIGFGSIVVPDPVAMTECVVQAIEKSGVYAILSKGWSDRFQVKKGIEEELGKNNITITRQIYEINAIPHDWLFARIDAACHHGGAGTTGASLRAGIPTIIKPFFGDQFFWSERVEALGVGISIRKLSVDSLASALLHATTDTKQIERAKSLGRKIRAENGVQTAIESIYRDLEYARTLARRHAMPETERSTSTLEHSTALPSYEAIRRPHSALASSRGSREGAPSEDWSIVSDEDESKSPPRSKSISRRKMVTKPLHALHDAIASATSSLSQVL